MTRLIVAAAAFGITVIAAGFVLRAPGDPVPASRGAAVQDTTKHDEAASIIEHELSELRETSPDGRNNLRRKCSRTYSYSKPWRPGGFPG